MRELSLHILDAMENSLEAGATLIEVTILEDLAADRLIITIRDNGRGMSEAQLAHVFNSFSTTRSTRHVGLGIPLFKAAAERCNGSLTITSQLEKGTSLQVKTSEVSEGFPSLPAHLIECDAPPLFITHAGRLVLLPVVEEESQGHLVRECDFTIQDGDHIAMVSEGYVRARGQQRQPWRWQDVAVSIRRWTETGCDAEQLLGALIRSYHRLAEAEPVQDVTVLAMHVRPMRSATVWSGPPADPALDRVALEKLMAEPRTRIVCGDTTAEIAARLLGAELELEPRPEDGWAEVPPISRLEGVNLVTEGLVTLSKARERMAGAKRVRDLPRKTDGATRLAQMLLTADTIRFIVGLAVNPEQATDVAGTIPLRRIVIDDLVRDLKVHGKVVSVEYF